MIKKKEKLIGLICGLIIILITAGCENAGLEDSPPDGPLPFSFEGLKVKRIFGVATDFNDKIYEAVIDRSNKTFVIKHYNDAKQPYISVETSDGENTTLQAPDQPTIVEFNGGNFEWIPSDGEYHTIKFTIDRNTTGKARDFFITFESVYPTIKLTAELSLRQNK